MTAETIAPADNLEQAVETAAAEAEAAGDLLDALEERVLAGDPEVTADEFEQARGLAKFARKRAEGAQRRKEAAEQAQRSAAIDALIERFEQAYGEGPHVFFETERKKFEAAVEAAAAEFMVAAMERDNAARPVLSEASRLELPLRDPTLMQDPTVPLVGFDRVQLGHRELEVNNARDVGHYLSGPFKSGSFHEQLVERIRAAAESR